MTAAPRTVSPAPENDEGASRVAPQAPDARRHPARTLVPVLPTDTATTFADRYPWFVPELTA